MQETLGRQSIREWTNIGKTHLSATTKNSVFAVPSPPTQNSRKPISHPSEPPKHCAFLIGSPHVSRRQFFSCSGPPNPVTSLPPTHDSRKTITRRSEPPKHCDFLPPTHDSRKTISHRSEPPKRRERAPTNARLPKTIFTPKRTTRTLRLRSHQHKIPNYQFLAQASHTNTDTSTSPSSVNALVSISDYLFEPKYALF